MEVDSVSEEEVRETLGWITLDWESSPFACKYQENGEQISGLCSGTQDFEHLRVVWYGAISDTALFHEITHWVLQRIGMDDPFHSHREFWDAEESISAEYRESRIE